MNPGMDPSQPPGLPIKIGATLFLSIFAGTGLWVASSILNSGETDPISLVIAAVLGLAFFIIPIGMIIWIWRFKGAKAAAAIPPDKSLTESCQKLAPVGFFVWVFGTIFMLIGLLVTSFWAGPLWIELAALASYRPVSAVVLSSEVKTHTGSDSTTYSIQIRYRYTVDGQSYESNRYDLLGGSSSGYKNKAKIVRQHPVGAEVICYVSPEFPDKAVLVRDWQPIYLITGLPVLFFLIGLGIIVFRKKFMTNTEAFLPNQPPSVNFQPTILKPKQTAAGQFLLILFISLFWNGITAIFVWLAFNGEDSDGVDLFLLLFMIPFMLVGIFLILGVIYSGAAIFNPTFQLRTTGPVALGMPFNLDWQCLGSTHRISHLTLTLQGEEVEVFISGSGKNRSRREIRSTFFRQSLVDTNQSFEFRQGNLQGELPSENIVPSINGSWCKIEWKLSLRARIKRWPDVTAEYPVIVQPYPAQGSR
jgi:hypothetical protein